MDATLPLRGIHSIVPLLHEGPNHDLGPLLHTGRSGERRTIHQDVRPLHDTQGVTPPTQTVAKAVDWTPEEDYDLLKLRRRRKPWKEIKTVLKGRSTYSCQQRYHDLKEKQGLMPQIRKLRAKLPKPSLTQTYTSAFDEVTKKKLNKVLKLD